MDGDASDINVYVLFAEEGPAYDAVSQMSAESWGYNVEPPPLPQFLLENAVALLRRPKPGDAPPEGDLRDLENEDPSIHKGLLIRFMRFSPDVDRLGEMMDSYRRNLVFDAPDSDIQAMSKLKRRGCKVTRSSLEYRASIAWKKRAWIGQGRYRYLLPVIFPEDPDIIEALGTSIDAYNSHQSDDKSRIRVYSAQMVWNLCAAVTIQCAWRAYRTRKQYREAMRNDLLQTRAGKFIRDWIGWQIFNKRLSLCKAISQVCAMNRTSIEQDVFLTAELRAHVETYMKRQPPRVAREQRIRFTINKEDRIVIVAEPKSERQGLPKWTGLDIPVMTLEEVAKEGLPPPFPLGDISPILLHGSKLEDVVFRPDKPRPALVPEVRIRYASSEEARNRICVLLTLTWHLHERRGIRLLQIPTAVQLLLQAIDPNAPPAKMMRLTEVFHQEEQRIRAFIDTNFGTSSVRPFLEDLLLHSAREQLRRDELNVFGGNPGGLIGLPPTHKDDMSFYKRFPTVREVPLLIDTIYEDRRKAGTMRAEGSKSIGAAAAAPSSMQLPSLSSISLSTYFQPIGFKAPVPQPSLMRAVDGVHSEASLLLLPTQPPAEARSATGGAREARLEMFMTKAEIAHDVRSTRAEWQALMHLNASETYELKRRARSAVIERARLEPRSLNTASVKPLCAPDILPSAENARIVQELRTLYKENARQMVDRERSAHKEKLDAIKKEKRSELQELHHDRIERRDRNERLAATTRVMDRTVRANLINQAHRVEHARRAKAQTLAGGATVVRRLASVANLLVKQQRQKERERVFEDNYQNAEERRIMAAKWSESTREKRDGRREYQRTRREREMTSNLGTIQEQRAKSARSKASYVSVLREEERVRLTLVPPAGGTMGSVAKELHIGKKVAPLSSVMSAAEVEERKRVKIIPTNLSTDLRGWSPPPGTRVSTNIDAGFAGGWSGRGTSDVDTTGFTVDPNPAQSLLAGEVGVD